MQLRLAALCDEALGDPLGAAWHYGEFLRLAPDSPERSTVEKCREAALAKVAGKRFEEKVNKLEEENRRLRQLLVEVKKHLVELRRRQAPPPPPRRSVYTVRSGDTPALVAAKYRVSVAALLRANGLAAGAKLQIGQELTIPK